MLTRRCERRGSPAGGRAQLGHHAEVRHLNDNRVRGGRSDLSRRGRRWRCLGWRRWRQGSRSRRTGRRLDWTRRGRLRRWGRYSSRRGGLGVARNDFAVARSRAIDQLGRHDAACEGDQADSRQPALREHDLAGRHGQGRRDGRPSPPDTTAAAAAHSRDTNAGLLRSSRRRDFKVGLGRRSWRRPHLSVLSVQLPPPHRHWSALGCLKHDSSPPIATAP